MDKNKQNKDRGLNTLFSQQNSVTNRLLIIMLAISIIPVVLFGTYVYISTSNTNLARVEEEQSSLIKGKIEAIEKWSHQREIDMATLAGTARVQSMDETKSLDAVMQYYELWGTFKTMFVADLNGMMTVSSNAELRNISDFGFFREAILGNPIVSEPLRFGLTDEIVIIFASPILSNGNIVGVAGGTVTMDVLEEMILSGISGFTTDLYMVDKNGLLITHPKFMEKDLPDDYLLERKLETQAGKSLQKGDSGQSNYRNYLDKQVLGSYSTIPGLGWGLILEKQTSEIQGLVFQQGIVSILIIITLSILTSFLAILLSKSFTYPIKLMASRAHELASGNISQGLNYSSNDEFGALADSIREMVDYQREIVKNAELISQGNLSIEFCPKSSQDSMGKALQNMTVMLNKAVAQINLIAIQLAESSTDLKLSAQSASSAIQQIASTIQQTANGTDQNTESISKTVNSIEAMVRAINGLSEGAKIQTRHANTSTMITNKMTQSLQKLAGNASAVNDQAQKSALGAKEGSKSVLETIQGMNLIHDKVSSTSTKVQEVSTRSDDIGEIVNTIEDISSQTNLLAINAAIEAAHAETQARNMSEFILDQLMTANAKLINKFLACQGDSMDNQFWVDLSKQVGVDMILVTDEDGVTKYCNETSVLGYRFSEDPKEQSYVFRKLLAMKDGVVTQPTMKRSVDSKLYKFVGVSRSDKPGIIQVAFNAESIQAITLQVGGFKVVANEVYQLAEKAKTSAKSIEDLIKKLQQSIVEINSSMDQSREEVKNGLISANHSGEVLNSILDSIELVSIQANEASDAALNMTQAANELVSAVDTVSAVVEENTAATEQMSADASEVNFAIDSIAAFSEETSASLQVISDSAGQISAQVEGVSTSSSRLAELAGELMDILQKFKLA